MKQESNLKLKNHKRKDEKSTIMNIDDLPIG